MRDSFGGTMLFWIVIFFLALFMSFMAVVIQYSRVYKIKNNTIEAIERGEGICNIADLNKTLQKNKYYGIYKICYSKATSTVSGESIGGYYSITLYAQFKFSNFGINMPISGESRIIEIESCNGDNILSGASTATIAGNTYKCVDLSSAE